MSVGSLASATVTETDTSEPFDTSGLNSVNVALTVTAVDGTGPTLDLALETTADGTNYYEVGAFPQQTLPGDPVARVFGPLGGSSRWSWEIGGTDPEVTFQVDASPADPTTDQPYLTATELRAMYPAIFADETKYPDAAIERKIARFEAMAERARGVSYRVRAETETITVRSGPLLLARREVSEITSLSYDVGTAGTAPDLDTDPSPVKIQDGYKVTLTPRGALWPCGTDVTIDYLHGLPAPLPCILDGCALFVRCELTADQSSAPRNAFSYTDPVTGYSMREGTADWDAGRYCKWIGVNDAINEARDYRAPGLA